MIACIYQSMFWITQRPVDPFKYPDVGKMRQSYVFECKPGLSIHLCFMAILIKTMANAAHTLHSIHTHHNKESPHYIYSLGDNTLPAGNRITL